MYGCVEVRGLNRKKMESNGGCDPPNPPLDLPLACVNLDLAPSETEPVDVSFVERLDHFRLLVASCAMSQIKGRIDLQLKREKKMAK